MSFKISCPHCARALNVTEPAFGKTVSCPGCKQPMKVPHPTAAPAPAPIQRAAPRTGGTESRGAEASPPVQLPPSMPSIPDGATPDDPLAFLRSDPGASASPAQLPPSMPSLPDLAAPGRPSFASAFPKGTPSRFLDFFDFGFKRYLTPWIVRHIWLWTVCLLGLGLMIQVAIYVHKSLPSREVVNLAIPPEARMRKGFLDELIRNKERPEVTETPRGEFPQRNVFPAPEAPEVARNREPEPSWRDEYSKMTLRQLRKERESLDESFPETGTRWTLWSTLYLATAAAAVLGTILTLVILRVCCELIIVVFNIAASLTTIADNTAISGKSPRG